MELADSSIMDKAFAQDDERNINASFVEVKVGENPSSLSVTQMDVKAMQASECTDFSHTSDNDNDADDNVSRTQKVPDVLSANESSKEIELEKDCPSIRQEADNAILNTFVIQDAFIFCPMMEPIVLIKTLEQSIFASETKMSPVNNQETPCRPFSQQLG